MANASREPPGGGDSAVCASGIATCAWQCRWPSQLQLITARSRTKRYGDRGRRGQERWRSRTSTKRYDDRRLLHRASGRSLLRRCPSRRRGSGGTRGLASSWCSTLWCHSWHERTRGKWRRSGSSWLTNAPARPTCGTRSRTPLLGERKKRRKKRTPRTSSSRSTPGRARRRHRQWHVPGWFSSVLAVFPSYVGRPKLLGIIVGMDHNDSFHRARRRLWQWHIQGWFCWLLFALCSFLLSTGPRCFASWPVWTRRDCIALFGSGICKARFTGDYALRSMFTSVDDRPKMIDIMAGTDQKNSYVDIGCMLGWFCR